MASDKNIKSKVLVVLSYVLASALFIAGIVLVAVYYPNFEQYQKAVYYFNEQTKGLGNFQTYLSTYNNNAQTNSWIIATIDEFAPGLTMLIVGIILMVVTIFINLKLKKNQHHKPKVKKIKKTKLVH